MIAEMLTSPAAAYALCFVTCFVSAVAPWLANAEVIVISLSVFAGGGLNPLAVALVATVGQMLGKSLMYWTGRGTLKLVPARQRARIERWRARFDGRASQAIGVVFVSALVGVPPLLVISVLAGSLRVSFAGFATAGTCGRFLRFTSLVYLPHVVAALRHAW